MVRPNRGTDQRRPERMIFQVKVRCIGETAPKKLGGKWRPYSTLGIALVESENIDDAMIAGREFIESQASPAYSWKEFYSLSAAPVFFPVRAEALLCAPRNQGAEDMSELIKYLDHLAGCMRRQLRLRGPHRTDDTDMRITFRDAAAVQSAADTLRAHASSALTV